MQEELTQKWAIVSLLDEFPEGGEFYFTDFPLHVTFAGVFACDLSGAQLGQSLADFLQNEQPIEIEVDRKEMFGANRNIGVMLLMQSTELMRSYKRLFEHLESLGVKYNEPQYQGDGWLPHSTIQMTGRGLGIGEKRQLTSLSLVDMFPGGDGVQRRITKTIAIP